MSNKSTNELTNELKKVNDKEELTQFKIDNKNEFLTETLSEMLKKILRRKNLKQADVTKKSNISKSHISDIFNGNKKPSRDNIIAIAFGMNLSLEETQNLLKRGCERELYPRDSRDSIIIFAINKKMNLTDCNLLLQEMSEELLINPSKKI